MRSEEFAAQITDLRDRRGLSPDLASRLWWIGDSSLVAELDRATSEDIERLNAAHDQAMDFERSMRKVDEVMNQKPSDIKARLQALVDELADTPPRAW